MKRKIERKENEDEREQEKEADQRERIPYIKKLDRRGTTEGLVLDSTGGGSPAISVTIGELATTM